MLQLRDEQLDRLSDSAWADVERRLLVHVQRFWPAQCVQRGDEGTLESVREAIARCRSRGLNQDQELGRYVDLCFCFGDDFEQQSWARAAVASGTPNARVELACLWHAGRRQLPGADVTT